MAGLKGGLVHGRPRPRRWRTWARAGWSRLRRTGLSAVLAVPPLLLATRAWERRWTTDDGFINFRVVRMILDGHGPVFNIGERVETTTSALWLWMLVLGDILLPLRLEWIAVVLGVTCASGGLVAAMVGAARLQRHLGATGALLPAGALVLAVVPPVWDFTTSGLEGGLTFGWLGLTSFLLARWATGDGPLGAGAAAVAGLGWLVRPDLVLVSVVVVTGVLVAQWPVCSRRAQLRLVTAAVALPLTYQVFRMGYYANVVPNTAQAKSGTGSRWSLGLDYLRDFAEPYWLVVPVVALLAGVLGPALARAWSAGDRRTTTALVALPAAGLLHTVYVIRVGGDYMHARMLLPALAALTLPLAVTALPRSPRTVAAEAGARSHPPKLSAASLVVLLPWSVICLLGLRSTVVVPSLFSGDAREAHVAVHGEHAVTATDQWDRGTPRHDEGVVLTGSGEVLSTDPPLGLRTPAHASYSVGVLGYVLGTDVYIIDMLGLADPVTSRFDLPRRGQTGHEKQMPTAWLAARVTRGALSPEAMPHNPLSRPLYTSPPGALDEDAAAARDAMGCGDVARLRAAVTEPMDPARFLRNLAAAPGFAVLTVPPDPRRAAERFCD